MSLSPPKVSVSGRLSITVGAFPVDQTCAPLCAWSPTGSKPPEPLTERRTDWIRLHPEPVRPAPWAYGSAPTALASRGDAYSVPQTNLMTGP
ncbi:hypothetical protein GCM10010319_17490 [Streptomyces blastmyceticus]|uniref:Uncharacterized protein n=1 Tax=Streptomyces blastmyceticus TaxID=68180 RepID=A0ABN0WMD3_9ACTN